MPTAATRIYVRHAGDSDPEVLAERDRRDAEHREALEARIAAADPSIVAAAKAHLRRRCR